LLALFEKNSVEIDGRDLIWFVLNEQQVLSNYPDEISDDLISHTKLRYRLKQGDIKRRLDRIDLSIIFSDIDSMPMRKNEMQH
jgi:hypothetical protein|tara:strand:+ start:676 stop:924 length:249 start_codon:yes stop_codon:yes gene_type:complete